MDSDEEEEDGDDDGVGGDMGGRAAGQAGVRATSYQKVSIGVGQLRITIVDDLRSDFLPFLRCGAMVRCGGCAV